MESIRQMIKEEFCAGNSRPSSDGRPKAASFKGGRGLGAQARQALEPVVVHQDGPQTSLRTRTESTSEIVFSISFSKTKRLLFYTRPQVPRQSLPLLL
jgi:hypothetical protein